MNVSLAKGKRSKPPSPLCQAAGQKFLILARNQISANRSTHSKAGTPHPSISPPQAVVANPAGRYAISTVDTLHCSTLRSGLDLEIANPSQARSGRGTALCVTRGGRSAIDQGAIASTNMYIIRRRFCHFPISARQKPFVARACRCKKAAAHVKRDHLRTPRRRANATCHRLIR